MAECPMGPYCQRPWIKTGDRVQILKTHFTEQRTPHLVGGIGIVLNVPVHPNTWYKVKFDIGLKSIIHTYRASALQPVAGQTPLTLRSYSPFQGPKDVKSLVSPLTLETALHKKRFQQAQNNSDQELNGSGHEIYSKGLLKDAFVRILIPHDQDQNDPMVEYNGETGVIIEVNGDKCNVLMDKKKFGIVTVSKHKLQALTLADISERHDEPDFWVGRRVFIQHGKFEGRTGIVTRSGNGWVQLHLDHKNENISKRAHELRLIDETADTEALDREMKLLKRPDDPVVETKKQPLRNSSRIAAAISWINKKVILPDKQIAIVRKVDSKSCQVELIDSKVMKTVMKEDVLLLKDEKPKTTGNRKEKKHRETEEFLFTFTHGDLFKEQVKRHVSKHFEQSKRRPNIQEWKVKIDFESVETGDCDQEQQDVLDLLPVKPCRACGLEKENEAGACWNENCPVSPVYCGEDRENLKGHIASLNPIPVENPLLNLAARGPKYPVLKQRKRRMISMSPRQYTEEITADPITFTWIRRGEKSYSNTPPPVAAWKNIPVRPETPPPVVAEEEGTKSTYVPSILSRTSTSSPSVQSSAAVIDTTVSDKEGRNLLTAASLPRTSNHVVQFSKLKVPEGLSSSSPAAAPASYRPQFESVFGKPTTSTTTI